MGNYAPQLFELKGEKATKNKSRYLNFFFVISLVLVVTHNAFTQLDIPVVETTDISSPATQARPE